MNDIVTYNYFPSPNDDGQHLIDSILSLGIVITHCGKSDPPKKLENINATVIMPFLLNQKELNRWLFLRSKAAGLEMTLNINRDPRWNFSSVSISGTSLEETVRITALLAKLTSSFLAIQGISGLGKGQKWNVIHCDPNCPKNLLVNTGLTNRSTGAGNV